MGRQGITVNINDLTQNIRQRVREQTASLNQSSQRVRARAEVALTNASDRFFRADKLTLADQTPFRVLFDDGLIKLRYYLPLNEERIPVDGETLQVEKRRHRVPVVIVPPLAVKMSIYDLFPDRSLVKYLLARGYEVYLIDWGVPGRKHTHFNLNTYISEFMPQFLQRIRAHAGVEDLTLHGWSLGGVFTLGYSALSRDPNIRNIVIVGTPIDGHASGAIGKMYQQLAKQANWVRKNTSFRVHNINPNWLHTPGWANVLAFKMLSPVGSIMGYWDLLKQLGDREYVVNHATNGAFLDNMVAYPGGIVQDMLIRVWIDNDLADGLMTIGEKTADLLQIKASLLAFAGKSDTMVTADAVRPLLGLVGSSDSRFEHISGGHMGILAGSKAPKEAWRLMANWLSERSA